MVEVLVNVLLERLATLALDEVERELKLVVGVKQEIINLTVRLGDIRAVLEDAEQRQVMESSVKGESTLKRWLDDLTDVSFDMDDVLDEWITRVLKHQFEKQEKQAVDTVVTTKKKVCFPFPTSCFRFGQVDYQLFLRHEIAKKIEELKQRLASIEERKQNFNFQNITRAVPELPQSRPKTTSLPNVKTFGRDSERNLIVSKLLSESSEGNEVPLIIPIVGMGGMGKTSLAQLVYNDEKIKSHFDKSIWVCVSDPFEEIKIAKAILERLGNDNTSDELEHLVKNINESIEGKKFLLVLDDVWNPKPHQWEELIKPLRNGAMGSRILVTTRKKEVATNLMKATKQMISLEGLGEELCLKLFYYSAGIDEGDEGSLSEEIQNIGLKLVRKCKGLPLAAKTLGSVMRNKKTNVHEWKTVLNSKIWELKEIQQDVFLPLLLSYQDLTPATKRCILYCAIYPKDFVYDKYALIESWMSQDYLNVKESQDKILVGQNVFDDLVMRSFFQDIEEDIEEHMTYRGIESLTCKIHDIVHDFLQYLTKNECLILNVGLGASETKEHAQQLSDKIRHLTLCGARVKESDSFESFLRNCKKLRTFTAFESDSFGPRLVESILELKCLRTMTLRGLWRGEIPQSIGGLIHLRYLDLSSNSWMEELPSAMGSLYNLQTLRLHNCGRLIKVDVRKLINLRHLYVDGCPLLWFIEGIEKLLDLQRLDEFRVIDGGNKLEHLKDLNQLRGSLTIDIPRDSHMAENAAAGGGFMVNKSHLLELILRFDLNGDGAAQREMMNGLEPHPNLESLSIDNYKGLAFSDWLSSSLHSLRFLDLVGCPTCKNMPPLGKLASLESLTIEFLYGVSKVGVEFLGITEQAASSSSTNSAFISFPKLQKLEIETMESWEEWEGVVEEDNSDKKNITIMPRLSELTIWNCEKLKALPDFLWNTPLQELEIIDSPILQNLYGGEQWSKISHIPNIDFGRQ